MNIPSPVVNVPAPAPDPALVAQQTAAQNEANQQTQMSLGDQQLNMLRQFGALTASSIAYGTGVPAAPSTAAPSLATQVASLMAGYVGPGLGGYGGVGGITNPANAGKL